MVQQELSESSGRIQGLQYILESQVCISPGTVGEVKFQRRSYLLAHPTNTAPHPL